MRERTTCREANRPEALNRHNNTQGGEYRDTRGGKPGRKRQHTLSNQLPHGGACTQGEAFYRKTCTPTSRQVKQCRPHPTSSDGCREPVRPPRQSMSAANPPGLGIMVPPPGSSPAVLLVRYRVPFVPRAVLKPARDRSTAIDHFNPGEYVSDRTRSRVSSMHL